MGYKLSGRPLESSCSLQHCDPLLVVPEAVRAGMQSPRNWLTMRRLAAVDCWGIYAPFCLPPPGGEWAFEQTAALPRRVRNLNGAGASSQASPLAAAGADRSGPLRSRHQRSSVGPVAKRVGASASGRSGGATARSATAAPLAEAEPPEVLGGPAMARPRRFVSRGNAVVLAGAGRFVKIHRITSTAQGCSGGRARRVFVYPVALQRHTVGGTPPAVTDATSLHLPDKAVCLWPTRAGDAEGVLDRAALGTVRSALAPEEGPSAPRTGLPGDGAPETHEAATRGEARGDACAGRSPMPAGPRHHDSTAPADLVVTTPVLLCPRVVTEQVAPSSVAAAAWAALARRVPEVLAAIGIPSEAPAMAAAGSPLRRAEGPPAACGPAAALHCRLYCGGDAICGPTRVSDSGVARPDHSPAAEDAPGSGGCCSEHRDVVLFAAFARFEAPP